MNSLLLISEHGWQIAGWTMVYFLALGTLVAIVAAVLRWVMRSAAPALRYATSLTVFAGLTLLPAGIAVWLSLSMPAIHSLSELPSATSPAVIDLAVEKVAVSTAIPEISPVETAPPTESSTAENSTLWTANQVIEHLPWLWLIGTPLTFLLLATGLVGAERLRRSSRLLTDGAMHDALERLRTALGIGRNVAIAICDRVATPLLVGIVRPLILLPPSALTGWSPDDLEMVLLHELAHVKRWDNLVNVIQRIVESALFFHPGVWLASHWVRADREDCCDAVVVARTAKPQAYAELLVSLASPTQPLAGLALSRHPLGNRIRRILRLPDEPMRVSRGTLVAVGIAILLLTLATASRGVSASGAEDSATENTKETEGDRALTEEVSETAQESGSHSTHFPSLEEQRLADVAYKVLGVELEKLTDEELKEVQTLGYKGGLRVDSHGGIPTEGLRTGDLLVGLHVWPTDSLEQVSDILTRDDLDQLSPLKFYAYRSDPRSYGGPSRDEIVTGRVSVNLDAWRSLQAHGARDRYGVEPDANQLRLQERQLQQSLKLLKAQTQGLDAGPQIEASRQAMVEIQHQLAQLQSQKQMSQDAVSQLAAAKAQMEQARAEMEQLKAQLSARPEVKSDSLQPGEVVVLQVKGALPDEPISGEYKIESMGTVALGPTYGRVNIAGHNVLEAEDLVKAHLSEFLENPLVQLTLKQEEPQPFVGEGPGRTITPEPPSDLDLPVPPSGLESDESKKKVLYDGKTFEEWRDLWKTELKTENRIECIKALAAFGRAGYGTQAVEAILDVAEQYDFTLLGDGAESDLKQTILEMFQADAAMGIPKKDLANIVLRGLESSSPNLRSLANWLLPSLKIEDEDTWKRVLSISQDEDNPLSRSATQALIYNDTDVSRPETLELVHHSLQRDQPYMEVLGTLHFKHLDLVPEQLELLVHQDLEIGASARRVLSNAVLSNADVPITDVLDSLLPILADPAQKDKHADAIRAIKSMSTRFSSADRKRVVRQLEEIAREGDEQLLGPSLSALKRLFNESTGLAANRVLKGDQLSEERKQLLQDRELLEDRVREEERAESGFGGGGRGFEGGGGGGGFF